MHRQPTDTVILAPREGVNHDSVRVVAWLVEDGTMVSSGTAVVTVETTKATFDVEADRPGHVFRLCAAGDDVPVGAALAVVSGSPRRPGPGAEAVAVAMAVTEGVASMGGPLFGRPGPTPAEPAGCAEDVEAATRDRDEPEDRRPLRIFRGEPLDPGADWDVALDPPLLHDLRGHLTGLRKRLKAKFNRHVPTGTLLHDRWDLARDLGFGEGTSVYDECLVLGDVKVGRHCWIGPYTVLDGLHAELKVGDHVDIGTSAQIYTHNTIERALTGHRAPMFAKATTIGNCCFIAPQATIAPGSVIGDHSFVTAGSFVQGVFPPYSYIAGTPAKLVGTVEIRGDRARIRPGRGDRPAS